MDQRQAIHGPIVMATRVTHSLTHSLITTRFSFIDPLGFAWRGALLKPCSRRPQASHAPQAKVSDAQCSSEWTGDNALATYTARPTAAIQQKQSTSHLPIPTYQYNLLALLRLIGSVVGSRCSHARRPHGVVAISPSSGMWLGLEQPDLAGDTIVSYRLSLPSRIRSSTSGLVSYAPGAGISQMRHKLKPSSLLLRSPSYPPTQARFAPHFSC